MTYLKNIFLFAGVLFMFSCGDNPKDQRYQTKLNRLQQENDSLKKEPLTITEEIDSVIPIIKGEKVPPVKISNTKKAGKHPISLQWISWDHPGTANIKPLEHNWYSINGSQKNKDGDYLTIDGKIKRISEKELEFDGIIITKVKHNNNGQSCVKEGKQNFYAQGDRKYYRLQNMDNCEGDMLVDYVDIYAGASSL